VLKSRSGYEDSGEYSICRLILADEQIIQTVTSVQQLANMETELEQALERVRHRKVYKVQTQTRLSKFLLEVLAS